MKKSIVLATILAASIPYSNADSKKVYLGIDLGKASQSWSEYSGDPQVGDVAIVDESDTSLAVVFGAKANKYFGFEMGYNIYGEADTDVLAPYGLPGQILTSSEITALDFGIVGYLPVSDKFAFKGLLGMSLWDATFTSNLFSEEAEEDGQDLYYGIAAAFTPNEKFEIALSYKILNMSIDSAEDLELRNTSLSLRFFL